MPCYVPRSSVYGSPVFTWPPRNLFAWNWTQVSLIPGWVLKLLDFSEKQCLLSWLPFAEGMCSWLGLVREGLSPRWEGMPLLGMLRELLYETDLELVSNAGPQAERLTPGPRSMGSVPGNAARGEFSCFWGAAGVLWMAVWPRDGHSKHQRWSAGMLPSPCALKPQCRRVSYYYVLI